MATVEIVDNTVIAKWEDESGTGGAVRIPHFPDKTVQATGTGTVTVEGSPDGTNWAALNDTASEPISLDATANAVSVILENTKFIRAVVAGGTATVTIVGIRG